MHIAYDYITRPGSAGYAPSIEGMNPEIAEHDAILHEASSVEGAAPSLPGVARRLAVWAIIAGIATAMVIGTRWGIA